MQSSQHLSASAGSILMETDDQGTIASRTRSRKRMFSQMAENEERTDFDILECFPILLCQYVFQHFNGQELLEMSKVNREWNKLVGEKPQVGKLKLVISRQEHQLTRKAKNILLKSERKYENIAAEVLSCDSTFLLDFIAKRAGSWKSVHLKTVGKFEQDFWPKILQIIEPTVEEMSITDWYRTNKPPNEVFGSWKFPRLGYLTCYAYHRNVFKYFDCVTSLVAFSWKLPRETAQSAIFDVRTILRNNHKLVRARAESNWPLFDQPSDIKFQLQELSIDDVSIDGTDSTQAFIPFLKTQALTLKSLTISSRITHALLELVLGMPKLTSLTVSFMLEEIRELPVNKTITFLEVEDKIRGEERKLVRAVKGLKRLKTGEIDDDVLWFLAREVPDLESIVAEWFHVSKLPGGIIFPKIKEFNVDWMDEYLRKPTGKNNFAKLLRKRMSQR